MKELKELIKSKALFTGEFILSSGRKSNFYVDMSKVSFDAEGINLISRIIIEEFNGSWQYVNAIGGPAMGAICLTAGILTMFGEFNIKKRGFSYLKQYKSHGKKELIEGDLRSDDRVVVLEDVTTTGNSLLKCVQEVQKLGCKIAGVMVVLDREEGAIELFKEKGIHFHPLIKISDII